MKDRIKAVRKSNSMTQTAFGQAVGVTLSAEQKWELGLAIPSDAAIMNICSKFGIRESWLRTGEGEMKAEGTRVEELQAKIERLFSDQSAMFQQAFLAAMLQFDPHGEQWSIVEEIYNAVAANLKSTQDGSADSTPPDPERAALHAELDRQLDLERGAQELPA